MKFRPRRRKFLRYLGATPLLQTAFVAVAKPISTRSERKPEPLPFREVQRGVDKFHHLPSNYQADVLIRWGDPLHAHTPPWQPGVPDPVNDAARFGYNNDYVAYFPLAEGTDASRRGLLCVNHEYVSPRMMWRDLAHADGAAAELSAMGHSVVEVALENDHWRYNTSRFNRRTTGHSAVSLTGPAAGNLRLINRFAPNGTTSHGILGACGGGKTPWGTVLVAEENFNFYFSGASQDPVEARAQQRYGIGKRAAYPHWAEAYPRFRADEHPRAANAFGWIVEIDPYEPASIAKKRTALGRFKHESADCVLNHDQRVVVYSGDDETFEYIYRFVSRDRYDPHNRQQNLSLLDHGTLSVARCHDDGRLTWHALVYGQGPLVEDNGFHNQGDVLIETRRAADLVGATKMDRPEEIETNPLSGEVYILLTNNLRRQDVSDRANPRAPNPFGHILKMTPPGTGTSHRDHAAQEFRWESVMLAGNPADTTHGANYPAELSSSAWFAAPDNCAFDPQGRFWIATDQGRHWSWTDCADGLYACDFDAGVIKRFFRAPIGAEVCGPEFTPDGRTLFLAVQHPGADGVKNASFTEPGTAWPDFDTHLPARPSVLAIRRKDGGDIGG